MVVLVLVVGLVAIVQPTVLLVLTHLLNQKCRLPHKVIVLLLAQVVLRQYSVPRVMVKVADADRAKAYRKLGLNCLNASAILAGVCEDWMTGAELKPVNDYAAFEAKPREN